MNAINNVNAESLSGKTSIKDLAHNNVTSTLRPPVIKSILWSECGISILKNEWYWGWK